MYKTVTIGWLKQRSGRYALKGITVFEGACAYDSMSTFRDEDARWLTKMLGAEPRVELSSNGTGQRMSEEYPEWAHPTAEPVAGGHDLPPLDWERASATLLRHFLGRLIEEGANINGSAGFQELAQEANAVLLATDAGTHYTLDEARTVLGRRGQQPARAKSRR